VCFSKMNKVLKDGKTYVVMEIADEDE